MTQQKANEARDSRWTRLKVFALSQLLLCLVVAIIAALLASQRINLGFEAFFREGPATAIAVIRQWVLPPSTPELLPTVTATPELKSQAIDPDPEALTPAPDVTAAGSALPGPKISTPLATDQTAAPPAATPEAEPTLVGYVLRMSNPELENILQMERALNMSAGGRDVRIRYTETALNAEVAVFLERFSRLPYRDVLIDLQGSRAVVTGNVSVLGLEVEVEAIGEVEVEECRVRGELTSLTILGVQMPDLVGVEIQGMVDEANAWIPEEYPLCITGVTMDGDYVEFFGYRP